MKDWREVLADDSRPRCSCPGTDEQPWNPECVIHTVGHYHKPGCCDVPQEEGDMAPHRHMSPAEYNAEFPKLFGDRFEADGQWIEVSARRYWDGVGLTITRQFHKDDPDSGGLCFDVEEKAIGPLAASLTRLAGFLEYSNRQNTASDGRANA